MKIEAFLLSLLCRVLEVGVKPPTPLIESATSYHAQTLGCTCDCVCIHKAELNWREVALWVVLLGSWVGFWWLRRKPEEPPIHHASPRRKGGGVIVMPTW